MMNSMTMELSPRPEASAELATAGIGTRSEEDNREMMQP
jgi:hypothetical protein